MSTTKVEEIIDFGAGPTEESVYQAQPSSEPSADELKVKFYEVDLPSKGMLGYPETIKYRDILVRDEKILSTATGASYKRVIGDVLKSLLEDQTIYPRLTTYDRDFLLMWIWANNYTPIKEFGIKCAHCESKQDVQLDITQIELNDISRDYEKDFPIEMSNGEIVKLNLLTMANEMVAEKYCKDNPKADYASVLFAASMTFKTVMGLKEKVEYIDNSNIRGKDMAMVRAFHDHFKYGLKPQEEHHCDVCGEVTPYEIPFSVDFFLPTLRNDFESLLSARKRAGDSSK